MSRRRIAYGIKTLQAFPACRECMLSHMKMRFVSSSPGVRPSSCEKIKKAHPCYNREHMSECCINHVRNFDWLSEAGSKPEMLCAMGPRGWPNGPRSFCSETEIPAPKGNTLHVKQMSRAIAFCIYWQSLRRTRVFYALCRHRRRVMSIPYLCICYLLMS